MAQVIVVAGASGSLGRYVSEALIADDRFQLVAISRQVRLEFLRWLFLN